MLEKIATATLIIVGVLLLITRGSDGHIEVRVTDKPPPVVVGPPPDHTASLLARITSLEEKLAARPASIPSSACQCKPCLCDPCLCKPVKGERLPESPYKAAVAKYIQPRPVYRQQACYGGRCYVPQRRGLFGWRR